jgi:hypothetical protein
MVLRAMSETDREAVRKLVARATRDHRVDGGLELPGVASERVGGVTLAVASPGVHAN